MANLLFSLLGKVALDTREAERGLDSIESKAKNTEGRLGGLGKSFGTLGKVAGAGALLAGAAMTGVAVTGIRAFSEFDAKMREVFTLLPDLTEEEMGKMREDVKQFSREFGVLPDELIPSLYQAISAGVPKDNVFDFLEVAQKAAIGGVTTLETAVDGITSTVNAYGDDVISAAEASDLMFTAVRLGKTTFDELSNSLFQVNPIAASLGVEFGDVTAALAALTAQGVPTSVAATQMRGLLTELSREGGKASEAFKEAAGVGFRQFIDEGGNVADALDLMREHAEANGVSLFDMFSRVEAGNAALALAGENTDAYRANIAEMGDAAGATDAAYATMSEGLKDSIRRIRANFAVLWIEIGERLMPVVERFADYLVGTILPLLFERLPRAIERVESALRPFVRQVEDAGRSFAAMVEPIARQVMPHLERFAQWFVNNRSALIALGIVVGTVLVGAFTALAVVLAIVAIAKLAIIAPALAILAAIGLLAAGVVLLIRHWDDITARFPIINSAINTSRNAFNGLAQWFTINLFPILQQLSEIFLGIARVALEAFTQIAGFAVEHWGRISNILSAALEGIWRNVEIVFRAIVGTIEGSLKIINGVIDVFIGVLTGDWRRAWDGIVQILRGTWQIISTLISTALDLTWNMIRTTLDMIARLFGTSWNEIVETVSRALSAMWEGTKNFARDVTATLRDFITVTIPGWFTRGWDAVSSTVSTTFSNIWQGARDFVTNLTNTLRSFLTTTVPSWFKGAFNKILEFVDSFINGPIRAVNKLIQGIAEAVNWITDKIGLGSVISISSGDYSPVRRIPSVGRLAKGTMGWGGGAALIGEQGPELGIWPRGMGVIPNKETEALMTLAHNVATAPGVGGDPREQIWNDLTDDTRSRGRFTGNFGRVTDVTGKALSSIAEFGADALFKILEMGARAAFNLVWDKIVKPIIEQLNLSDTLKKVAIGSGDFIKENVIGWLDGTLKAIDEELGAVDGQAVPATLPGWFKPASGRVTQRFGRTAFSMTGAYGGRGHSGIDIANSMGTPIFAANTGMITSAGNEPSSGYGIAIRQIVQGLELIYAHLQRVLVTTGQMVRGGTRIGLMDSTGFSFGSHLHFETRRAGTPINPEQFVKFHDGLWNSPGYVAGLLAPKEMVVPDPFASRIRAALTDDTTAAPQNILVQIGDETVADIWVKGSQIAERTGRSRIMRGRQ